MAKWDLFGRIWHMNRAMPEIADDKQHIAYLRSISKANKPVDSSADIPLHDLEVVVVDLETTGFYPDHGDELYRWEQSP
ncbi:hypothetical protein [Brevibacillus porteri]|uniref:hypothetical protein n=1 Tax=Brevibacillus porteri TaxID=2126350 RepID=UPI003641002D